VIHDEHDGARFLDGDVDLLATSAGDLRGLAIARPPVSMTMKLRSPTVATP